MHHFVGTQLPLRWYRATLCTVDLPCALPASVVHHNAQGTPHKVSVSRGFQIFCAPVVDLSFHFSVGRFVGRSFFKKEITANVEVFRIHSCSLRLIKSLNASRDVINEINDTTLSTQVIYDADWDLICVLGRIFTNLMYC